jgi:hypothetical protein
VSTLANVFEAAGLATIALGSVRKQIESGAPPRGLLCDFPLGRPLGKPNDAEFQHKVLAHAFALLDSSKPVIEVFPESVASDNASNAGLACPLPPRSNADLHPAIDEIRGIRPAYDRAIAKFGNRASTGRVLTPDDIELAVTSLLKVAEGVPWKEAGIPGIPSRVAQDIRGYYEAAALELSDHVPSAWAATNWFLDKTETGKVVLAARAAMRGAGEKRPIWFYMVPGDR